MRFFSITVLDSLEMYTELTFVQETHPSRTEIRDRLKELNGEEVSVVTFSIHEFKSGEDYEAYTK